MQAVNASALVTRANIESTEIARNNFLAVFRTIESRVSLSARRDFAAHLSSALRHPE